MSYGDDDDARRAAFADDDDDDDWGGGGGGLRSPSDEPAGLHSPSDEPSGIRSPSDQPFGDDGDNEEHFTSSPTAHDDGDNTETQEGGQAAEAYDWSAFRDDSGQVYYYNSKTQESAWEAPNEPYNPLPPEGGDEGAAVATTEEMETEPTATEPEKGEAVEEMEDAGEQTPPHSSPGYDDSPEEKEAAEETTAEEGEPTPTATTDDGAGGWVAFQDDEGREYFYNNDTGETQWERPASMGPPPDDQQQTEDVSTQEGGVADSSYDDSRGGEDPYAISADTTTSTAGSTMDEGEPRPTSPVATVEEEAEPELSPAEKAELALNEPDAILEPGCLTNVNELLKALDGNVGGQKAIQSLVAGYHGQTAICGLLGLWLAELKSSSTSKKQSNFISAADTVRTIAENVVNTIAKEKFTKAGGDSILSLSKAEVAFLEEMFESNRWRKLLIDLSATHKDSALLMYCLQKISKRGHHREIAKRINQSDYFGVFNSMLAAELTVVGKLAVGGNGESGAKSDDGSTGIDSILADLKRTCSSTSYTYLYAIEVLNDLVHKVKTKKMPDGPKTAGLLRAVRKWDRLREELEDLMMNPPAAGGASKLNPLARKRRVDVALNVSDLYQRQRRRLDPTSDAYTSGDGSRFRRKSPNDLLRDTLDTAVVSLLKNHSLGIQVDKQLADDLLKVAYGGSSDIIGDVLIANPSAIKALLENLFRPGSKRNRNLEVKQKCARLIALAVLASERSVKVASSGDESSSEKRDDLEDQLRKVRADKNHASVEFGIL
mmetsp:Transcript_4031/g.6045  ORF Transcript_4031/g.6045 Transcript_4031/m.6045 type:complete len:774 (+) Transcript_4031:236-2557(+)